MTHERSYVTCPLFPQSFLFDLLLSIKSFRCLDSWFRHSYIFDIIYFSVFGFQGTTYHQFIDGMEMERFELLTPCLQGRCSPNWATPPRCRLVFYIVGLSGLEPPTSRLSGVRSNRLSYKPALIFFESGSHLSSHTVASIVLSAA